MSGGKRNDPLAGYSEGAGMSEAPERIWARPMHASMNWSGVEFGPFNVKDPYGTGTEYIRADLHTAAVEAARAEEWEKIEPLQKALKEALDAVLDGEGLTAFYLKVASDQRERDAAIAERWLAKDMHEAMSPGAMEQNSIARQIAAAIREGE